MSIFDNFKPRRLTVGSPFISISNSGVSFNKSAIDRLEYPEFVIILINEDEKRLAIKPTTNDNPYRELFVKPEKKETAQYVRWNNKEFTKQLLAWAPSLELKNGGFKVPGVYIEEEKAFLFSFCDATAL